MRKLTSAIAAVTAALCARAEAATYTFTPTSIGMPTSPLAPIYDPSTPVFTLALADAAVQSGSFAYDYRYRNMEVGTPPVPVSQPVALGDVQALQLFSAEGGRISFAGGNGPVTSLSDYFSVNLRFSAAGTIDSGSISYSSETFQLQLAGTNGLFQGTFAAGILPTDTVTGAFAGQTNVPEPATLGMVGLVLAISASRRRRPIPLASPLP